MMRKNLKDRSGEQRNKAFCCKAPPVQNRRRQFSVSLQTKNFKACKLISYRLFLFLSETYWKPFTKLLILQPSERSEDLDSGSRARQLLFIGLPCSINCTGLAI